MGLIQFHVRSTKLIDLEEVHRADFVTFDGRVIQSMNQVSDGVLTCHRAQTDSSKLRILCRLGNASYVFHTAAIRESAASYNLEQEIARGMLTRLRNFHALWTSAGLKHPPEFNEKMKAAHHAFRKSIFDDQNGDVAVEAVRLTHEASTELIGAYTAQRIVFRRRRSARIPMSVGCRLIQQPARGEVFLQAFNSMLVRTRWNALEPRDGDYQWEELDELVEWGTQNNLTMMGGPLLDLSSDCFPEWMSAWRGDLVNLQSFSSDFVETVVGRYIGKIRHWEVVSGANCGGPSGLTEEQRLNLVIRAVEAAQQVDEQIQISLRIVQPWGEYLSGNVNRLPPIQFVDTLRRSGARIAEVNLDMRYGGGRIHSQPRDMMSVSQLLDHWSLLQMPLNVMVALPERDHGSEDLEEYINWQAETVESLMSVCLAKERVSGFYCLNWSDPSVQDPALIGQNETVHPAVARIIRLGEVSPT